MKTLPPTNPYKELEWLRKWVARAEAEISLHRGGTSRRDIDTVNTCVSRIEDWKARECVLLNDLTILNGGF